MGIGGGDEKEGKRSEGNWKAGSDGEKEKEGKK